MPRTSKCVALVKGRRIRVTRLDGCGRPVIGEYGHAVSDGITTVAFTANTTDSEEISQLNFNGDRCVFEPSVTSLTGYGTEITFCNVDFEVFELITGQTLVFGSDGAVVGIEVDTKIKQDDMGFALEVWAGAPSDDACAPGSQGNFGYLLLPLLKGGYLSDFTVENANITFTITGATTREGNDWGAGSYAVESVAGSPAVLSQPVSPTAALRLQITTVAPPAAICGARPLLDPTLPTLSSIAGVEGDSDMEADFTTTPDSTGPVWWDFGDGEWDYVAIPGAASHLYTAPGTYTVRASQNGVSWSTTTVTVPYP